MVDIALMSVIRQRLYDSVHDSYLGFGLPEQQDAAVVVLCVCNPNVGQNNQVVQTAFFVNNPG